MFVAMFLRPSGAARLAGIVMFVALAACGGKAAAPSAPQPAAARQATRWVPSKPTFVVASPVLDDALRDLREVVDALSVVSGIELGDLSAAAQGLIGVDVLHGDALAAIGVDVRGSWAAFSDDLAPTFVVHLASPDKMKAFVGKQRERGLAIQTAVVDQIEVSSTELMGFVAIRWAIDGDWMWVHLALVGSDKQTDDAARWFLASHHAHPVDWSDSWAWAQRAANSTAAANDARIIGFFDVQGALAQSTSRLTSALACVRLAPSIGRLGFGLGGDAHHLEARLAVEAATDELQRHVLPAPPGWDATALNAAVSAQWNLDLSAARRFLEPCSTASGRSLAMLDDTGVRAGRGMLLSFEPDKVSGSAAFAFDVASPSFFARQLDRVPMRSSFERATQFGKHAGFSVDIPLSFTFEYVLEPQLVVAGIGEGLVGQVLAYPQAPPAPPSLFAFDIAPPKLSAEAWGILLQAIAEHRLPGSPGPKARRAAERLLRWRTGHVALTAEGNQLVLTASGEHL